MDFEILNSEQIRRELAENQFLHDPTTRIFLENATIAYRIYEAETIETWILLGFQPMQTIGGYIPWVRMHMAFTQKGITQEGITQIRQIRRFFHGNLMTLIFEDNNHRNSIDRETIGYTLAVIPRVNASIGMFENFSEHNWSLHINFADSDENDMIESSFHLYWQNSHFSEQTIPPNLLVQMDGAHNIVQLVNSNSIFCNDPQVLSDCQEVLRFAQFKIQHRKKIKNKLRLYNFLRKSLWAKVKLFEHTPLHPKIFGRCYKQNVKLQDRMGIKISIVKTTSPEWALFRSRFRIQIILTLIECLLTEGSSYTALIDQNGNFNPHCFEDAFLDSLVGNFVGIMEMQIQGRPIFAGIAYGTYHTHSPATLRTALLFPKIFRKHGLGQILAMYGMEYMETHYEIEKFEVFATSRNASTERLVTKTGFFEYGHIRSTVFDITGYNTDLSFSVGMNRTYRISKSLLQRHLSKNLNPTLNHYWQLALRIQEAMSSS